MEYRKLTAAISSRPTEENFESLLKSYPLLHGYWVKYALSQFHNRNNKQAKHVFERGLKHCRYSCDLWTAYVRFLISINSPVKEVRSIFLRAEPFAGIQFLSHQFWDTWIEYATLHNINFGLFPDMAPVEEILYHILRTKTIHQFSRYFKHLKQITKLDEMHLIELYTRQQSRVSKIWRHERTIKRPFFHPSPLSDAERKTWSNYIDFITTSEKKNLFSRALEIDPYNEHLWLQLVRWLIAIDEDPTPVLDRACRLLPESMDELRLYYALWLEHTNPDAVEGFYQQLPETGPIYCQYARYLNRAGKDGAALLRQILPKLPDHQKASVLGELLKYDKNSFSESQQNSPEFYKAWLTYEPEKADEIWALAGDSSIDSAYLQALRRTDIQKFVKMEKVLNG